jgi:glycerol-3-phosphate acyltransferase PlsY
MMTPPVLPIAAAFLIGSIPTAYLVGRTRGLDIRTVGSGNVGATNVFRVLGPALGFLTLAIDMLKGWLPVAMVRGAADPWTPVLAGLAAVLGHTFTPFLKFKGGKGVATSAGVFLALLPVPGLLALGVFLAVFLVWRRVSVGSLCACVVLPGSALFLYGLTPATGLAAAVALLVVIRHAANIKRLVKGEEPSFRKP